MSRKQFIQKVVINRCYGGFGLSRDAFLRLRELGCEAALKEPDVGEFWPDSKNKRDEYLTSFCSDIPRDDQKLLQVIEELGEEKSSAEFAKLKVIEVPDYVHWVIKEYDGNEWIVEQHQTWS